MTLHELLLKEGLTPTNHDRNRIGILIGRKAKELSITKTRKEESFHGNKYVANDYDEAFSGDMLIIVREYIANPPAPVPPKKIAVEQPKKKVKAEKIVLVSEPKKEVVKHVQSDAGKKRQQEWLEKRKQK